MNVVFRVDASNQIGSGHVMRCLTLAQALCERDATCTFICRELDGNLIWLIKERGFSVYTLPSYENGYTANDDDVSHAGWLGCDWQTDASETQLYLGTLKPDWLIVDHYAIDGRWEEALKSVYNKLLVIDDLADRNHICDVLLDQNLVEGMEDRYTSLVSSHVVLLLGPDYALLQYKYSLFHDKIQPKSKSISRILVYFGGRNATNITAQTISAFLQLDRSDIGLDIVLSDHPEDADTVFAEIASHENIKIHQRQHSLAELLLESDLAIGAGGVTNWERICLGVPTIVITIADNQIPMAQKLHLENLIQWLGTEADVGEDLIRDSIAEFIKCGINELWVRKCLATVDGKGVSRVIDHLAREEPQFFCRSAKTCDEQLLLEWANDPITRSSSFSATEIGIEEHHAWFSECLRNTYYSRIFIVETPKTNPIGTVRFNKHESEWEVHFALAPEYRGKGYGKEMVKSGINSLRRELGGVTIVGQVKQDNIQSIHIFTSLGFIQLLQKDAPQEKTIVFRGEA